MTEATMVMDKLFGALTRSGVSVVSSFVATGNSRLEEELLPTGGVTVGADDVRDE
jgi:uncharacterized protein (DUF1697 family)